MTARIHMVCPECQAHAICIDTRMRGGITRRRFKCDNEHRFWMAGDEVRLYMKRDRTKPAPKRVPHVAKVWQGPILSEWRPNPFQGA